jgi:DNA-binding GntR family transcriptional regulator
MSARYWHLIPGDAEIDRESAVPPYRQIAAVLRARIESGDYQPGRRLPSAVALTGEFGTGLQTARKALRLLASEGLAEISPGMGTYVRPPSERAPAAGTQAGADNTRRGLQ